MLFNQNNSFEETQFWTVGVASLTFYLDLWRSMLFKTENDFYSLVGFHCEYLRTQNLGNIFFYIKQYIWADTVLKSGCVQFLNWLTLTEMHSVEDRKWFLLTPLVSLRMSECWKIGKCWFSSKTVHLSRHIFQQWAWFILKFALRNRDT